MIKEILEQLAPLDAQIAALKGSGNDMEAITAHASELAELAVVSSYSLPCISSRRDMVYSALNNGVSPLITRWHG